MNLFKRKKKIDADESMNKGVKIVAFDASSAYAEQFNSIRTNIRYSSADEKYRSILIASSIAAEGKSTISANLAVSFARQGMKVLLVDADLRRPTIDKTFKISKNYGLTNLLTEDDAEDGKAIYETNIDNLLVLPSGPIPPNPAELLGSKKMDKLVTNFNLKYDLVIYDAAPVLLVSDSQELSTKLDGTILVSRANYVDKREVKRALRLFNNVDAKVIGLILNDSELLDNSYYYSSKEKKSEN